MNDCAIDCANQITRRTFLKTTGTVALCLYGGTILQACSRSIDQEKNYYIKKKDKLLKQFDEVAESQKEFLLTNFDQTRLEKWLGQARQEYELLIPQLHYVGGDENRITRLLLLTSTFIPILKILEYENIPVRQNGKMIFKLSSDYFYGIPAPIRWYKRWEYFSESMMQKRREAAKLSQLRRYSGDWVFEYVEGDGKSFEYGVNYTECALKKLWTAHGLEKFVPYLCLCDYAIWKAFGVETVRSQTLANGGDFCDFRYVKKGSNGISGWPPESVPEWTGKYEI